MESIRVPDALKDCDRAALQAYATACIIDFTSNPAFAALLGKTPDTIKNATLAILQEQRQQPGTAPPPSLLQQALASLPTPELASPLLQQAPRNSNLDFILAFRHDCLNVGCSDLCCQLCLHAQARRCSKNFCSKYLVGDALKAECGAPIRVQALDKFTGQALPATALQGIKLDAVLLNGRSVQAIRESTGGHITARDIEHAVVPTYAGRFLLDTLIATQHIDKALDHDQLAPADSPTAGGPGEGQYIERHSPDGRAILHFRGSEANISGFTVTGSSEGILSGQRPQFILLIRAIDAATGAPLPAVPPLLSEGFVVATSRVRTSAKKNIPHWNDDVSKLNSVGKATVVKLHDLVQASIDGGCPDLQLPLARVHTVAEFRQLADWAVQDKEITNKLKKILKLTKGWDAAREHAATAVQDDCCLRAWWIPSSTLDRYIFNNTIEGNKEEPGKNQGKEDVLSTESKKCALAYAADKGVPLLSQGPIALLESISPSSLQHVQQQGSGTRIDPGSYILKPLLHQNSAQGFVGWALDYSFHHDGPPGGHSNINSMNTNTTQPSPGGNLGIPLGSSFPSSSMSIPESLRASAPPFPCSDIILSSHAAWFQPHHPGWMSFPLPLTVEYLRNQLLTQPQQPIILSSQFMSMCCQYHGRGIQAVHAAVQEQIHHQQHQPHNQLLNIPAEYATQRGQLPLQPPLSLHPLPPPPPALLPSKTLLPPQGPPAQAPATEHTLPSFSSMLQSFPSLPPPEILSRLLSSLPSFDAEQAAAAAAAATGAITSTDQKGTQQTNINTNTTTTNNNPTTFLGRAISHTASDLLASMDALFPAAGGSGNSSSLFRGLTPDWGKLGSLSPQEWQQLLQLTEISPLPASTAPGNENLSAAVGGGDADLPSLRPPSNTEEAPPLDLFPPIRSVSAAKSIFGGKILEPSPFGTTDGSSPLLPPLPSLTPSRQQQDDREEEQEGQQEGGTMLNDEPSLKLMLPVNEIGVDLPGSGGGSAKKRQSESGERERALTEEGEEQGEEVDDEGGKASKQRRLSLP